MKKKKPLILATGFSKTKSNLVQMRIPRKMKMVERNHHFCAYCSVKAMSYEKLAWP